MTAFRLLFVLLLASEASLALRCSCERDPSCDNLDTCVTNGGACFASIFRSKSNKIIRTLRCLDPEKLIPKGRPFICEYSRRNAHKYKSACCSDGDFCNGNLDLVLNVTASMTAAMATSTENGGGEGLDLEQNGGLMLPLLVASTTLCLLLLVVAIIVFLVKRIQVGQRSKYKNHCLNCCLKAPVTEDGYHQVDVNEATSLKSTNYSSATTKILTDHFDWSSSGSGLPLLVQRSVARQVTLLNTIGQGRYGEVWKGEWRGEFVAVKIFSTAVEKSWFREVEIFQTVMLRHENILGFIAADNKDNGTWTQLWLITEYMENGSLFDFLSSRMVSHELLLKMAISIATGLAHLHMEIVGTQGKPAIAHRDLKSKNILVKSNGVCAIGDLGMAVRYDHRTDLLDIPETGKVGTKRYLAPEVLDDSIDTSSFESFKHADVYALSLVFWEICQRNAKIGEAEFQLPYSEFVGPDPSLDEMRKIVCIEKFRPEIPSEWADDLILSEVSKIMQECWYDNATSRLTALRVKKTLASVEASNIYPSKI